MWCHGRFRDCKNIERFHFTCLFCRYRRSKIGKYIDPKRYLFYPYLCLPPYYATAFKVDHEHKQIIKFKVQVPQILQIDPRGHFTHFRMCTIMRIDRLAIHLNKHPRRNPILKRLINMCEFLANYPNF